MQVYVVIKDKEIPNPYDLPNNDYVMIDCIRASEDSARERLSELAREGYRNADYIKYILR